MFFDFVIFVKIFLKFLEFVLDVCICGFVDVWRVFCEYLLGRFIYKLEFLVKDVMKVFYNVYFVIEDVVIL